MNARASVDQGVADHLTVRELADRLRGLTLDQVRGLVDRGAIRTVSFGPGTKRYVPPSELQRLRALGFTVQNVQNMQNVQDSQPTPEGTTVEP